METEYKLRSYTADWSLFTQYFGLTSIERLSQARWVSLMMGQRLNQTQWAGRKYEEIKPFSTHPTIHYTISPEQITRSNYATHGGQQEAIRETTVDRKMKPWIIPCNSPSTSFFLRFSISSCLTVNHCSFSILLMYKSVLIKGHETGHEIFTIRESLQLHQRNILGIWLN